MLSEKKARLLAENLAKMMLQYFETSMVSVCIVGSLASGEFIEGKSDLDLVVVLKEDKLENIARSCTEKWIANTEVKYGLEDQIEVFIKIKRNLCPPYNLESQNMFEIARIIYQAVPIAGELNVKDILLPPIKFFEDEYAALKQAFLTQKKSRKLVLKYMRYENLLKKGIVEFNKEKTIGLYFDDDIKAFKAFENIFRNMGEDDLEEQIENWMLKNFFEDFNSYRCDIG